MFALEHIPSLWIIAVGVSIILIAFVVVVFFSHHWKDYKRLLGNYSNAREQIKEKDKHIATLESRIEVANGQIKRLEAVIKETECKHSVNPV